jgi:cation diffusion facilitator family transporter
MTSTKSGAALLSIASNSLLILLKVVAGVLTGSIAILTEAIHSAIDLIASLIAFVSVRMADEPADADHPYGHEKAENVAAGAEAMLILLGAVIVVIEAIRRLFNGSEIDEVTIGIVVIGFSVLVNLGVSTFLFRRADVLDSPALAGDAAHLRADALTSIAVLVGLVLVEVTGVDEFDSIAALTVAGVIVATGVRLALRSGRVLMDEAPPASELDRIEKVIARVRPPAMAGYHKLRARRAGSRRHIDMHVQFRHGTSLEEAHRFAHELRSAIEAEISRADVLIHVEPEGSLRETKDDPFRHG